jgi:DNA-binding NarL/FixJ family response regulator
MSTSVVIAEPHDITLWSIQSIVEDHGGTVAATPQTGVRTLTAVENQKPQVLILSLDLPRLHGFEVLRHLHNRTLAMETMVLTAQEAPSAARDALKRGVTSYVFKSDPLDSLGPAFEATAAGERVLSPALPDELMDTSAEDPSSRRYRFLTDRQKEILKLTAEGHTGERIGEELGLSRRTIEKCRREMREELGLSNVVELTRYAVEMGFYKTSAAEWLAERAESSDAEDENNDD